MTDTKSSIREVARRHRERLPEDVRKEKSMSICRILTKHIQHSFKKGAHILFFAAKKKEVNIIPVFQELVSCPQKLFQGYFPKVVNLKKGIFHVFPVQKMQELKISRGHFGIPEPVSKRPLNPQKIDLVLTPAVAVDSQGNRIGYGGGYYDRFFQTVGPDCKKWAVVFSCQRVEKINADCHDVPVDAVIDEFSFSPF